MRVKLSFSSRAYRVIIPRSLISDLGWERVEYLWMSVPTPGVLKVSKKLSGKKKKARA